MIVLKRNEWNFYSFGYSTGITIFIKTESSAWYIGRWGNLHINIECHIVLHTQKICLSILVQVFLGYSYGLLVKIYQQYPYKCLCNIKLLYFDYWAFSYGGKVIGATKSKNSMDCRYSVYGWYGGSCPAQILILHIVSYGWYMVIKINGRDHLLTNTCR